MLPKPPLETASWAVLWLHPILAPVLLLIGFSECKARPAVDTGQSLIMQRCDLLPTAFLVLAVLPTLAELLPQDHSGRKGIRSIPIQSGIW